MRKNPATILKMTLLADVLLLCWIYLIKRKKQLKSEPVELKTKGEYMRLLVTVLFAVQQYSLKLV